MTGGFTDFVHDQYSADAAAFPATFRNISAVNSACLQRGEQIAEAGGLGAVPAGVGYLDLDVSHAEAVGGLELLHIGTDVFSGGLAKSTSTSRISTSESKAACSVLCWSTVSPPPISVPKFGLSLVCSSRRLWRADP